jgi:hypothetical protein
VPFDRVRPEFLNIREGEFSKQNCPAVLSGLPDFEKVNRIVIQKGTPVFQVIYEFDHCNTKMSARVNQSLGKVTLEAPWWYRGEYTIAPSSDGNAKVTLAIYNKASKISGWMFPIIGLQTEEKKQQIAFQRMVLTLNRRSG